MRPQFRLLDHTLVDRILSEALQVLKDPGINVGSPAAAKMLRAAGARVEAGVAHIEESLIRRALETVPREFSLYDRSGHPAVRYGGDHVHFDPGSSCLNILDEETQRARPATATDLVRLIQVAEMLPQYAAQSTAMVCSDVPSEVGDIYRLFLVLWYSNKPIVTGAFSVATLHTMIELLAADSGGYAALKAKPRAVFDVCPSPPLNWSAFAADNLIELAQAGIPAELISMPLAGATAPVTLAGSTVQHAAESLAGITIHQLACPGAPVVWGGAPAIFDMSTGNAPMGAIETAMLDIGCAEVGKSLNLPTHAYLSASDSRRLDAQSGMESGISAMLGALAGINMISGAGMLDFLACHSIEKLVIDAEAIDSALRLLTGVEAGYETLATGMFAKLGLTGEFLKLKETRTLFRTEQHFPSSIIDRGGDGSDIVTRAKHRVAELLGGYQRPALTAGTDRALKDIVRNVAHPLGIDRLPGVETSDPVAV